MNARLGLVCAVLLSACSAPATQASTVALLGLTAPPPCIGLPEELCRYDYRWEPDCTAFALELGKPALVTAAHCLPDSAIADLRFWAPSGWGHGHARLVARDDGMDLAFLSVTDGTVVAALSIGQKPHVGDAVSSWTPALRLDSRGHVTGWVGDDFFETDQSVVSGWSGAPILNARGEAVGMVARCPQNIHFSEKHCGRGRTVAVSLAGLADVRH